MQLVVLLLVRRHEHTLADDVVLSPVEHEDRGAGRDVGEALVDDQCTRILGQAEARRRSRCRASGTSSSARCARPASEVAMKALTVSTSSCSNGSRSSVPSVPARWNQWTCGPVGASAAGVLHHRDQLGAVAPDVPVELAGLLGIVTGGARPEVGDDAQAERLHHGDDAFGEVLVGGIVGVGQQRDLDVGAVEGAGGKLTMPLPSVSIEADAWRAAPWPPRGRTDSRPSSPCRRRTCRRRGRPDRSR